MSRRSVPLHLPRPGVAPAEAGPVLRRSRRRRRLRLRRLRQAGMGLLLGGLGVALLAGLVRIPDRLDALLLVSHALANVIGGLNRLGLGLLQLTGVLLVVLLALLALLLLLGGGVRMWRALIPRGEEEQRPPRGAKTVVTAARSGQGAPLDSGHSPPPLL
jgi:hypothetical protein